MPEHRGRKHHQDRVAETLLSGSRLAASVSPAATGTMMPSHAWYWKWSAT